MNILKVIEQLQALAIQYPNAVVLGTNGGTGEDGPATHVVMSSPVYISDTDETVDVVEISFAPDEL